LRIVYDNEAQTGFKSDWGFSCLIETEDRNLLFDTGSSRDILAFNLQQLHVQSETIATIVLSHEHGDHIGGLDAVLHPGVTVFVPSSFSRRFKHAVAQVADVVEVTLPRELVPGVYTTGELGAWQKEQSLVLDTPKGMIVVTGCAHPGLEAILTAAATFGELYGVIGGFHSFNRLELLRELELIVPCHCTAHKREILELYPEKTERCGAGMVLELG
jgi:7,8-dihydropterin-6-yl-methyl-4-(beta-D-ribofuranosyl)aminobenzene 5'-phosphate synthase